MLSLTLFLKDGTFVSANCPSIVELFPSSFVNDLLRYLLAKYKDYIRCYDLRENDIVIESYSFEI